jgi:hypothetical protein
MHLCNKLNSKKAKKLKKKEEKIINNIHLCSVIDPEGEV